MNNLVAKHCVPCEGGTPPLTSDVANTLLTELDHGWTLVDGTVSKRFGFKTFPEAIAFVDRIAELAEAEGHHPDLTINYRFVTVSLTTHAIKGLSENDFILAAKIQAEYDREE